MPAVRSAGPRAAAASSTVLQRNLVLAIPAGTALAAAPGVADTYNLPKFALLLVLTLGLVLTAGWRILRDRVVVVPGGILGWVVAAFVIALTIVTLAAPRVRLAAVGGYGRYDGFLTVSSCVVIFLVVIHAFDARSLRTLATVLVAAGLVVALVTVIEAVVHRVSSSHPPIRATIGNADFLAAYLAVIAPIALGGVLDTGRRAVWRSAAAIAAVLLVVGSALSGAQQGVAAAALGCAVTVVVWAGHRFRSHRQLLLSATAVGVLGVVALGAGLFGTGPLSSLGDQHTVVVRRLYWHVALRMFSAHPVAGVGPGAFGDNYFHYWSVHATHVLGPGRFADAAHDVPLTILAEGGLLLGLTYLAFVGYVGMRLATRSWHAPTPQPALLAGVAGAWVAYQASSLISIDKITLVVLNWTLAGAIVVLTDEGPTATFSFVRDRPKRTRRPGVSTVPVVATCVVGTVLAVVLLVPLVNLLRADDAYAAARRDVTAEQAVGDALRASALASWQPAYSVEAGRALAAAGDFPGAIAAFARALRADPIDRQAMLGAAAADTATGRLGDAQAAYDRLARVDVHDPAVLIGQAVLDLRRGSPAAAIRKLRVAQQLHRTEAAAQLLRRLTARAPTPA